MYADDDDDDDVHKMLKIYMTMTQVRLLLEKGGSVEGNIDLDLDILTETPLQVTGIVMMIFIIVTIMMNNDDHHNLNDNYNSWLLPRVEWRL